VKDGDKTHRLEQGASQKGGTRMSRRGAANPPVQIGDVNRRMRALTKGPELH